MRKRKEHTVLLFFEKSFLSSTANQMANKSLSDTGGGGLHVAERKAIEF
jgi:hypothetical protein